MPAFGLSTGSIRAEGSFARVASRRTRNNNRLHLWRAKMREAPLDAGGIAEGRILVSCHFRSLNSYARRLKRNKRGDKRAINFYEGRRAAL
jgi:hypothetical protein